MPYLEGVQFARNTMFNLNGISSLALNVPRIIKKYELLQLILNMVKIETAMI